MIIKFYVLNRKAREIHHDRFGNHKQDFYDIQWNKTGISQDESNSNIAYERPIQLKEMIHLIYTEAVRYIYIIKRSRRLNMKKITKVIKNPYKIFVYLGYKGCLNWLDDETYIKYMFRGIMGNKLNLKNPISLNEKIQWLKIYDRHENYAMVVDKYEVRKYIKDKLGEEYLIPLFGVWDKFDDIDFGKLPNQFVLKPNHTSGDVFICKDKTLINFAELKVKVNGWIKRDYYIYQREFPYKNIKPKIIAEQLLETDNGGRPADYKFLCFNGNPDNVMVCLDRDKGRPKFLFFDHNWNFLPYNKVDKDKSKNFTIPKPKKIDEMFDIAKTISKDFLFSRIDLYYENDKIYFGEITLYPDSGFDRDITEETDRLFGSKLKLPIK